MVETQLRPMNIKKKTSVFHHAHKEKRFVYKLVLGPKNLNSLDELNEKHSQNDELDRYVFLHDGLYDRVLYATQFSFI